MRSPILRTVAIAVLALGLGELVYVGIIVPQLSSWRRVPTLLWALALVPQAAAALLIVVRLHRWRDVLLHGLALGIVVFVWGTAMGLAQMHGLQKSLVWDNPSSYLVISPVLCIALGTGALACAFGVMQLVRRAVAPV